MEEEFYCILKLISGEEILSIIMIDDNDGDPVIVLQNPVVIKMTQTNQDVYLKIKPWIELSDEHFFIIKKDSVITMTEVYNKKLIELYDDYIINVTNSVLSTLEDSSSHQEKVKPSLNMGYITSVKEARENLEKIFKEL